MDTELDHRVSATDTAGGSSAHDPRSITPVENTSVPLASTSMHSHCSVPAASLPGTTAVLESKQRPSTWRTRLIRAAGFCCKAAITLQLIASACDLLPFGGREQRDGKQQAGSSNKQHSSRSKPSSRSRESSSSSKGDSHMDNEELLSTVGRVVLFLSGDGQEGAEELLQIGPTKIEAALEIIDTEVLEVMQVEVRLDNHQTYGNWARVNLDGRSYLRLLAAQNRPQCESLPPPSLATCMLCFLHNSIENMSMWKTMCAACRFACEFSSALNFLKQ